MMCWNVIFNTFLTMSKSYQNFKHLILCISEIISNFKYYGARDANRFRSLDLKWNYDPGGYWWPPTYSSWTPTIVSFSFPISLIVAQFTIFSSFRVLNFWSRFEALNDVFLASNGRENMSPFWTSYLLLMDVVLKHIFLTMYHVRQTEVVC